MPIFEYNGKKFNVKDEYIDSFIEDYPDASTVMEREGKKYRVKSTDYNTFLQEYPQQEVEEKEDSLSQQTEAKPLTDQDKMRFNVGIEQMKQRIGKTVGEFDKQLNTIQEYNEGTKLNYGQTVEGKMQFNPQSGKIEKTYISPTGNRHTSKEVADIESLNFRQAADVSVGGQLRRANQKLKELKEAAEKRKDEVANEHLNEVRDRYRSGGILNAIGQAAIDARSLSPNRTNLQSTIDNDAEYRKLIAAIHQKEEQIATLEREVKRENGVDVGFWRGFADVAGDAKTWDFGYNDIQDALAMHNASKGNAKTDSEKGVNDELLSAVKENQTTTQEYGDNDSFWYRAGTMTGHMPAFMLDFALTGGGLKGINLIAKGATKLATKAVGKEAVEQMAKEGFKSYIKNNGIKGLGQYAGNWAIKAMGTMADDLLVRAPLMTNTVQLGKTTADIIDRKLGNIELKDDGTYNFSNDKTWGSAIWQGEANNIIENYSEMFGAHLDPVVTLGNIGKLADVIGAKRIGKILAKADAGALGGIMGETQKLFNKMGVSDYFGEVTEEYYGQLWRTMLNLDDAYQQNPDGTRTNLLKTGRFHGDILGGMALSMGLMGAGKLSLTGAQYVSMKHGVNKADNRASELLGKEVWEPLREVIDNTTNDNFGEVAEGIVYDKEFTDDERAAILTYMERAMMMRGFNLATFAESRGEQDSDVQEMNESYIDGYNIANPTEMNDAKNMLDYQRQRMISVVGTNEEALDGNFVDWLNEAKTAQNQNNYERANTILDYLNAKQVYDGMMQRVRDDIDSRIDESNNIIDKRTNKATGLIQGATLKRNNRSVYIVNGNVVQNGNGGIDLNKSEKSIIVCDAETGEFEQIPSDEISALDELIDPTTEKEINAEAIRQQFAGEAADKIDGVVAFTPGDTYSIAGDNGVMQVQVVANEQGVVDNGDGTVNVSDGVNVFPLAKEIIQQQVDEANKERLMQFEEARNEDNNSGETDSTPTALELIPKDEQGNPIYEQTDSDTAWNALVEQTEGDVDMAQTVADGMVAKKEAALKKLEKAKSKGGETPAEMIAAEKERKAAIESAKQELDAWKMIAGTANRRRVEIEAEQTKTAQMEAERIKAEEDKLRTEREEAERIEREALNGVPDMVEDAPQDARARGYRRVNGHKVDRQEPVSGLRGKEVEVKFSDNTLPKGRVAVIEADELQPSHIQGMRNPLHFIDEAQPKERNDEASILSAQKIASNIRPEEITSSVTAYTGAPTVNTRGEAIQGNNRSDALKLMWSRYSGQGAKYKQYLMDHAEEFGLKAEDIAGMKRPVLVNMLDANDEEAITLGQFVAQDTESGGVERIKPKNALQRMGADMRTFANMLLKSTDEETSFAGLVDSNGVDVLKWMSRKGYISPTQYQSAFDSKGNLTAEVKNDLKGIMYQSIFKGGSTRLEEMFNAMPAKAQKAILATAFRDYDSPNAERMIEEIQNSIRAFYALSQSEAFMSAKTFKDARLAVEGWKNQYQFDDVTGESYLPAENFSNFALLLATMYKGENQSVIQGTFNKLYDIIQGTQEPNLFEQPDNTPRSLAQAIKEVLNLDYNGQFRSNVLVGDNSTSQRGQQGSTGDVATGERVENGNGTTDSAGGIERGSRGIRSESEDRTSQSEENATEIKSSMSTNEAIDFVADMELIADVAPEIDLTIENWDALFGESGTINTPIGEVKMGENQFAKLMRQGREGKLGMIKPTLENPHAIVEEASEAKEGDTTERTSSYIFIRSFKKADGSRFYYFTSITVSKDGREVVVSSQEKSRNKILRLLQEGSVIWRTPKDATTSSAERQGLDYEQPNEAETATKGSGITPQSTSSESKDTTISPISNELGEKNNTLYSITPAQYTTKKGKSVVQTNLSKNPTFTEEKLDNGDKRITNYNSRGEVATVAIERNGKIVSVDSYDEGILFEHTEYDENLKAASVTRYDKQGNSVGTQKYENGKAMFQSVNKTKDEAKAIPNIISEQHLKEVQAEATRRAKQLTKAARELRKELNNNPEIVIFENISELPEEALAGMSNAEKRIAEKGGAKGWFSHNGKVYISLKAAAGVEDLKETLFHEAVAHKGLRELLGKDNFNRLCQAVYKAMPEADQERIRIREEGARNGQPVSNALIADEYMAELAEKIAKSDGKLTIPQRIVSAIRNFFRRFFNLKFNEADIKYLLYASYKKLKGDEGIQTSINNSATLKRLRDVAVTQQADNAVRNRLVYHGSGAEFDRFDHNYMGTGEGAQAFGWGTYVTDVEGIGRTYATTMRDNLISEKHKENAIINKLAKETLESNNGDKEEALNYLRSLLDEDWSDKKRVKAQIKIIETGRFLPETKVKAHLYNVDIPDDNGTNYIHWDKQVSPEAKEKAIEALYHRMDKYEGLIEELNHVFSIDMEGDRFYSTIGSYLGGDKQASQFLSSLGFVGISYPAQATTGERADGARNFVIFNEDDARIVEHTRFRLTQEEQDINSKAQANGTYLKAPNGKDTNLSPEQWARVRTKAFKAWFGDWEKYARIEKLKESEPINVEFNQEYELNRDSAKQWMKDNLRGEYKNEDTEEIIQLSKTGINEVTSHGTKDNAHLKSIVAIPSLIKDSIFIEELPNEKGNNKYDSYRYYVCGAKIDGIDYTIKIVVGVKDNSKYYDHRLTQIEKGTLIDNLNGLSNSVAENQNASLLGKDSKLLSILQTNSSKIVDENGEPMVVYHNTPNEFTIFDENKIGSSTDAGAFGRGFYFSPDDKYSLYGKNKMALFLNAKNPLMLDDSNAFEIKEPFYNDYNWGKKESEAFTQWVKDNGYDAVIYKSLGTEEDVVFTPTQIKSATENVGTYDKNNPDIRFRHNDYFISNAENAVLNIKQDKATPDQWIAMLKNNGGLKAGEDKWLGLEDWLKAQKGSVTKQEVLDYIAENEIQIEEVTYTQFGEGLLDEATRKLEAEYKKIGWDAMKDKYPGIEDLFEIYNKELVWSEELASIGEYEDFIIDNNIVSVNSQDNAINETREKYTTPGLERNREIALTVPTIESWNESDEIHFGDAGNGRAIAWIRFGETTDSEGKATLVIDEIQSKRHQEGREKGYGRATSEDKKTAFESVNNAQKEFDEYETKMKNKYGSEYDWSAFATDAEMDKWQELYDKVGRLGQVYEDVAESNRAGIPDAPFDKNWHELAMKQMLRLAAEEGYDKIAWTTGEQQADRYDMSREIESIQSEDETITEASDGTPIAKALTIRTTSGMDIRMDVDANGMVRGGEYNGKQISDVLGKELGEKVMEKGNRTLTTPDLKLGGEGMKGFYDKILPTFMNKYGKKWGVKTESVELPSLGENGLTMHSVDVTPEMRESVMQGQVMFRLSDSRLRKLEEGEVCNVERIFTENKNFDFTSGERIESFDDVAFIFKQLQDESVENSFAVLVKDGVPTVIHLGMGGYTSTIVNGSALSVAVERVQPDKIYFVHNHPSGALKASAPDLNVLYNLKKVYGDKVVQDGIIINLHSGKYGTFGNVNEEHKEKNIENAVPIKVFSFNKQVFKEDYNPSELFSAMSAENVASFISSQRLGKRNKLGVLVCNNQLGIVGNIFTKYTEVTNENAKEVAKDIVYYTTSMGGNRAIIFGDGFFKDITNKRLSDYVRESSLSHIELLDYVNVNDSGYLSANEEGVRFRIGGNSGYVGYSMSVRAAQAREEGRYPKTDFLKEYGVSAKALQPLVDAGIISDREWHHTSKFGNKTTFYGWNEEEYADIYQDNKKEIDNLLKLGETENVKSIFDTKLQEYIDAKAEAQAKYMNEVKEYGKYRRENLWIPEEEYQAQNGVKIVTNGSDSPADWIYLYNNKPAFKNYASKAREELEKVIKEKNSGILSFKDWKSQQANDYRDGNAIYFNDEEAYERMAERVEELANKLHLDNIDIVTDASQLEGKKRRAKGFYSKSTGKINIVIPNHRDMLDVEQTLLHEAVAHYGLRELFGEEFDNFLDNIYAKADKAIQERIVETSKKMYNNYVQNAIKGVRSVFKQAEIIATLPKKETEFIRTATEEYLASLAENTEFENCPKNWWNSIKEWFKKLLDKFGFSRGVTLNDNSLRYILWRSYENLKKPANKRNALDIANDIAKRYELKVGNFKDVSIEDVAKEYYKLFRGAKDLDIRILNSPEDVYDFAIEMGLSEEDAKESAEESKKNYVGGGFYPNSNIILIFAFKDLSTPLSLMFHEHVHYAIEQLGGVDNVRALSDELKELDNELVRNIENEKEYKKEDVDEEIISFSLQAALSGNAIEDLKNILSEEAKSQMNALLEIVGYDKNINYGRKNDKLSRESGRKQVEKVRTRTRRRIAEYSIKQGDGRNRNVRKKWDSNFGVEGLLETSQKKERREIAEIENDDLFRDGDPEIHERVLARDRYERRVKSGMFQSREALQDSMLGLKEAMQAIVGKETNIEDIEGFENAYLGENRLSSVNKAEADAFAHTLFKPMLDEVAKLAKNNAGREELTDYMMAKHGLERNRVMAERDARAYINAEIGKLKKELKRKDITENESEKINRKINLLNAKLNGVEKNLSERDAMIWYETRKKTIDNLYNNGEIDEEEYNKRLYRLDKIFKEGYIGLNRDRDYAGLTALTGMDNVADAEAIAQEMVDNYEQSHDTTNLWNRINAVSKAILLKSYESGLMSKETFNDVSTMYEFYIPLRGFDEKTSAEAYAYLTHKNSAFNAPIKKAKGRKSKADDPLANLESMAESAIMQGNRNSLVKQRFLNFVLNHPSDLVSVSDLWLKYDEVTDEWKPVFPDNIDMDDAPEDVERKMQEFEARMAQLAEEYPDEYKRGKDAVNIPYRVVEKGDLMQHQVIVKRGGRDYVITINGNPRAAQALNGQTNPDNDMSGAIGPILRYSEYINRELSAFYTTRNPDFIVSNFMRDMLYTNSMAWIKESPNYALRFHRNNVMVNPVTMKILFAKHRNGTLNLNDKTEAMFYQFMMNGGETGYVNIRDIKKHKNDIKRELKKSNGKIPVRKAWDWLGERFDEYNRAVENCARFAAFITSREMGRSIDRAIYDAKEISVNFNKKGSGAKFLGKEGQTKLGNASAFVSGWGRSWFIFWNVSIQGMTNFGRQVKRHPAKAFTGMATMFLLGALIAYLGGDDDEDDKNAYYNLPEYVRRSNIMFRAGDNWISIPLPIEFRAVYGMGELMTSVLSGKEHFTDGELADQIIGQISQILPLDVVNVSSFSVKGKTGREMLASALVSLTPSLLKPVAELLKNEDWTGLPIYKENAFNEDMPEWTKAYKSTNKYLVNLSATLNEATGEDKHTKGWININPASIEHLLNGYFGGVSGTIDKLTKTAETITGEREYDPRSILLWNRLVKAGDERTDYRAVNNEYFRVKDEAENTKRRLKAYEKDTDNGIFNFAEKIDFLYNSPEYKRYKIFEDYNRDIKDLNKELKEAEQYGGKEEIKAIETKLNALKKEMIQEMEHTYESKKIIN